MDIKQKLDQVAEYQSAIDAAQLAKKDMLDSVLTPEIRERMAEIELEFSGRTEHVTEKLDALIAEIKAEVKEQGASVKGDYLHAVYVKGRVTWDTKSLDGYAIAHPELLSFRKEGEASVTIRSKG